jgi:CRP-like cAMP-binding protein
MVFEHSRGHVNQVDGGELNDTARACFQFFPLFQATYKKVVPRIKLPENEIIFGQGEPAHTVFFITHGKVKCTQPQAMAK